MRTKLRKNVPAAFLLAWQRGPSGIACPVMIDYPRVQPYRGRYKPPHSEPMDQQATEKRQTPEQQRHDAARKLAERHNAALQPPPDDA